MPLSFSTPDILNISFIVPRHSSSGIISTSNSRCRASFSNFLSAAFCPSNAIPISATTSHLFSRARARQVASSNRPSTVRRYMTHARRLTAPRLPIFSAVYYSPVGDFCQLLCRIKIGVVKSIMLLTAPNGRPENYLDVQAVRFTAASA